MKKVNLILSTLAGFAITLAGMLTVTSCSEDEAPVALELTTLAANDIDLNAATSPSGVSSEVVITATFSTGLDPTTIVESNVSLLRLYDNTNIELELAVSGNTITITPKSQLLPGNVHTLKIAAAVASDKSQKLGSDLERSFTTDGFFSPKGLIAYWNFDDNLNDQVGSFNADPAKTVAITFADARKSTAGKAASFNGTTSIAEVPNADQLMDNEDFAISFWVKVNSSKEAQFVIGLGGYKGFQFEVLGGPWTAMDKGFKIATQYQLASSTDAEDTWWNGMPNGWQGSTFARDVSGLGGTPSYFKDVWAQVVCTYDATNKVGSMYVNGQLMRSWDFDLWPDGDAKKTATGVTFAGNASGGGNNLAFGFFQATGNPIIPDSWALYSDPNNNHFMGLLDDVRIFSNSLTEEEITLMYNSEKP